MENESLADAVLIAESFLLQRHNVPAFVLWTLCGIANAVASAWTIAVLVTAQLMTKETRHLVVQMSVVEMLGGFAKATVGVYHLIKFYANSPEVVSSLKCWLIDGLDYSFIVSCLASFYFTLSCDRFYAAVFPTHYKFRSKYYTFAILVPSWLLPVVVSAFTFFNAYDRSNVSLCLLRKAIGIQAFLLFTDAMLSLSACSVAVYVLIAGILSGKLMYLSKTQGSNIQAIKAELHNKVTRSLAANAILHLLTFLLAAFGNRIATWFGNNGDDTGPLFVPLYHVGSLTSFFIYFIFQAKFRQRCFELTKKLVSFSSNSINPA